MFFGRKFSKSSSSVPASASNSGSAKKRLPTINGKEKSPEQLLEMYGEFMIEAWPRKDGKIEVPGPVTYEDWELIEAGEAENALDGIPRTSDFLGRKKFDFADDIVENTRGVQVDYDLYRLVPNTPTIRPDSSIAQRNDHSSAIHELQGLGMTVKDLDVLFDAEEALRDEPAPVVVLDPRGIQEQFDRLRTPQVSSSSSGEHFVEACPQNAQMVGLESGLKQSTAPNDLRTETSSASRTSGDYRIDQGFRNAVDVQGWSSELRDDMRADYDPDLVMSRGLILPPKSTPNPRLAIKTDTKHHGAEVSELLRRRNEYYQAKEKLYSE